MPTDGPEQPNVVIRLSHSAPDTAYWRLYGKWLEQRPFDGVVMTIDPRDAKWHDEAYWTGQLDLWTGFMANEPRS